MDENGAPPPRVTDDDDAGGINVDRLAKGEFVDREDDRVLSKGKRSGKGSVGGWMGGLLAVRSWNWLYCRLAATQRAFKMTMPEKIEDDTGNGHELTRAGSQFNLRGMFFLTAASALWLFVLSDLRSEPIAIAIFWMLAVVAGIGGHLLYTYLLPWRGTVVTSLIVLSVAIFAAVATYYGDLDGVFDLLLMPIDFFSHQRWSDRIRFTIPVFACIAILTAAHPIKPSLINAIITAIGISLWYGVALLIAANAG